LPLGRLLREWGRGVDLELGNPYLLWCTRPLQSDLHPARTGMKQFRGNGIRHQNAAVSWRDFRQGQRRQRYGRFSAGELALNLPWEATHGSSTRVATLPGILRRRTDWVQEGDRVLRNRFTLAGHRQFRGNRCRGGSDAFRLELTRALFRCLRRCASDEENTGVQESNQGLAENFRRGPGREIGQSGGNRATQAVLGHGHDPVFTGWGIELIHIDGAGW